MGMICHKPRHEQGCGGHEYDHQADFVIGNQHKDNRTQNGQRPRKELREAGVNYTVVKNTLLRKAVEGTDLSELDPFLNGTTALAVSNDDHVAAARILCKYAEGNESFTIKTGFMDGKVIDLATINSIAKLPPRDILLATVCNAFNAPISALARALQAIVDKDGEAAPEAAAE